jgi:thioredoxin 1
MAMQFTDANFAQEVIEASKTKPVLVDFFAPWCGPCQIQGPIVEDVGKEMGSAAAVGKLDTEEAGKTAQEYGIMSIPTLLIFRNGKVAQQFVGLQSKEALVAALKKNI